MGGHEKRRPLPIALEGAETRDVESLPSYLLRLSAAHGVTPGCLFRYLLNSYVGGREIHSVMLSQPFPALARPTSTTDRLVTLLASLGCEQVDQLRRSTFLFLSPALNRSYRSFSDFLRWCPGCLHDQQVSGAPAHHKLSWLLRDVKACEVHKVLLRQDCPHCDQTPGPGQSWLDLAQCGKCDRRLDIITVKDIQNASPEATAPDLLALVEAIAARKSAFTSGSVNRYVQGFLDEAWASNREIALWEKLRRDEDIRRAATNESITLLIARRIAFRLEVPILDLLEADRPFVQSFGFAADFVLPPPMRPNNDRKKIDRDKLRTELGKALERKGEPKSLLQVARDLAVSIGAIHYIAPNLAKEIISRYAAFRTAEALRKSREASTTVRRALDARGNGASLTRKGVLKELIRSTSLPKNLLMAEIKAQWGS